MPRVSPEDVVRNFHENGLKLLLHDAGYDRDLLTLRDPDRAARIDFNRLKIEETTYVTADYRNICSDLVLKSTYRTRLDGRRRILTLYILIEHQSEPAVLMVLRLLEYLVQIYKGQVRAASKGKRPPPDLRLRPVLPIVFYTGSRSWGALTPLAELIQGGTADFADVLPQLRPVFLNLSTVPRTDLETSGGFFGWVLELIRLRHAPVAEFRDTTGRIVDYLEAMAETERERWLLFLSYIDAMVYHDRGAIEHKATREVILQAIRSDPRRREVEAMMQTMADVLREKGREEGREEGKEEGRLAEKLQSRQETLVRLLRLRFGRVPRGVKQIIHTTNDIACLEAWFDAAATVQTLADVGITAQPEQ